AVCVGLGEGPLLKPGNGGCTVSVDAAWAPPDVPSPVHVLLEVVPSNPFYALTGIGARSNNTGETTLAAGRGSILPVIFFAPLLGLAIVK
ncbi:dicarboxylate/amino acid:cation symporter, partial [Xylella fastidiosa subsp. multiplex]|nr:dicarboxylate/amino acid:cation symporter [Xylella fastidiosa subsp. multiplex]